MKKVNSVLILVGFREVTLEKSWTTGHWVTVTIFGNYSVEISNRIVKQKWNYVQHNLFCCAPSKHTTACCRAETSLMN